MKEFKRYDTNGINEGLPEFTDGQYILYSEAADHIAALEAEIARLRKDSEHLDFMLDEHCAIQEFSVYDMPAYNLNWYEVGEQQAEVYKSPREAIDAAIVANSVAHEGTGK